MAKITPKQAMFAAEYLIDLNATRAAIAAGFSAATAHVTGSKLLRNPVVAAAIADGQARMAAKLEVTAERVVRELAKLAFSDVKDIFDAEGNPLPVHRMNEMARAAIAGLETDTWQTKDGPKTVTTKFRLADKGQNLERLGKHLKIFGDQSFGASVIPGAGGLPEGSEIRIVLVRPE